MTPRIQIRALGEALQGFRDTWKAVEEGRKVRPQAGTYFTSLEAARRVLTAKRLELLRIIRQNSPESVYRLARIAGRDLKNVREDVRILAEHGLISLKATRGTAGRRVTVPRVRFKEIEVRIAV